MDKIGYSILEITGTVIALGAVTVIGIMRERIKKRVTALFEKTTIEREGSFSDRDVIREEKVYDSLITLRNISNGDRVSLFKFHNGEVFTLRSQHAWKMSCTNEVVRAGVSYEGKGLKSILMSTVIDFISPLFAGHEPKEGFVHVEHDGLDCAEQCPDHMNITIGYVSDMNDHFTKACLSDQGIVKILYAPIQDVNHIIGFVAIDYIHDKEIDMSIVVPALCSCAKRITYLLYNE